MKKIAIFLVSIMVSISGAFAQEVSPERLDLAKKYVYLVGGDGVFERSLVRMSLRTYDSTVKLNPDLSNELKATLVKVIESYKPRKDELVDQLALPYAIRFSEEELTEIVAFFESPVGKKLNGQGLNLQRDNGAAMRVWNNKIRAEFRVKLRDAMKELGHDI